jgi:hypothetical protein
MVGRLRFLGPRILPMVSSWNFWEIEEVISPNEHCKKHISLVFRFFFFFFFSVGPGG